MTQFKGLNKYDAKAATRIAIDKVEQQIGTLDRVTNLPAVREHTPTQERARYAERLRVVSRVTGEYANRLHKETAVERARRILQDVKDIGTGAQLRDRKEMYELSDLLGEIAFHAGAQEIQTEARAAEESIERR